MARKTTGNPPGRKPRTTNGTAASCSLRIRLTPEEHALLQVMADKCGYDSVAEYVRAMCLTGQPKRETTGEAYRAGKQDGIDDVEGLRAQRGTKAVLTFDPEDLRTLAEHQGWHRRHEIHDCHAAYYLGFKQGAAQRLGELAREVKLSRAAIQRARKRA